MGGQKLSNHSLEPGGQTCEEPVVIISDLHLGRSTRWKERLEPLRGVWRGAATMVFNGDTMNGHLAANSALRGQIVSCLSEMCASDGARAVFLAGNSDPYIDRLQHLFLSGGRVLVTHGDAVFPDVSPWRVRVRDIREARDAAVRDMPAHQRDTLEGQLLSTRQASEAILAKTLGRKGLFPLRHLGLCLAPFRLWAVMRAWRRAPSLAAQFLRHYAPRARFIVMGHTHRRGIWRIEETVVINTGSFEGFSSPAMVRLGGGEIAVQRIGREEGLYRPGETLASFAPDGGGS